MSVCSSKFHNFSGLLTILPPHQQGQGLFSITEFLKITNRYVVGVLELRDFQSHTLLKLANF